MSCYEYMYFQVFQLFDCIFIDFCFYFQVFKLYVCKVLAMLAVYLLQYGNTMLLGALVVSFIPAVFIAMFVKVSNFSFCSEPPLTIRPRVSLRLGMLLALCF